MVESLNIKPLTSKYFLRLNKSSHLFEMYCAFLSLFNPNLDFLEAVKVTKSGHHLFHDQGSKGHGSILGLMSYSLLLVLYSAPRRFSLGTPVFPSPQKPTFLNSNSIWTSGILVMSLRLGWSRKHSLCLTLNSHLQTSLHAYLQRHNMMQISLWHQIRNRPMPLTSLVVGQMARFCNFYSL